MTNCTEAYEYYKRKKQQEQENYNNAPRTYIVQCSDCRVEVETADHDNFCRSLIKIDNTSVGRYIFVPIDSSTLIAHVAAHVNGFTMNRRHN
jgi:hypothetical protein